MASDGSLPGTPLRDRDFKERRVLFVEKRPQMRYAWDSGIAVARYLRELKNGRLIGRRCRRCQRVVVPPRMFCEECFRPTDEWVYLEDTGTVNTYSVSYIRWDASRVREPSIPAVIEIDGASPGMGILHMLGEVRPDDVKVGMKVQAVWKPARQRVGSVLDIRYFRPL